jgi:hypothetical protein
MALLFKILRARDPNMCFTEGITRPAIAEITPAVIDDIIPGN